MDKSLRNFTPLKKAIHSKRKYFFAIGGILTLFILFFAFILNGSKQKIINKGQAEGLPTKNVSVSCTVRPDKRTGNVTCKTSYLKRSSANLQECVDCAKNPFGCLQGDTQGFLECTASEQTNWQCSLSTSQECGGVQIESNCIGEGCKYNDEFCDCNSNAGWVAETDCQSCFSQPSNTPAAVNSPTPTATIPAQIACYQQCTQGSTTCASGLVCGDSNEGNGVPYYLCVNPTCPGSSTCACTNPTSTPTLTPTLSPTLTKTPTPTITATPPPGATNTPIPTKTPTPTVTPTPPPGATNTPGPTNTATPGPTSTNTPGPTNTPVQYAQSQPTATHAPTKVEIPQAGGLFTIGKSLFVIAIGILIAGLIL